MPVHLQGVRSLSIEVLAVAEGGVYLGRRNLGIISDSRGFYRWDEVRLAN